MALAAKGNGVQGIENERHDLDMELLKSAIEYKEFARDLERKVKLGLIKGDDPNMPRPEDVIINMHTGAVAMMHEDFRGRRLPGGSAHYPTSPFLAPTDPYRTHEADSRDLTRRGRMMRYRRPEPNEILSPVVRWARPTACRREPR